MHLKCRLQNGDHFSGGGGGGGGGGDELNTALALKCTEHAIIFWTHAGLVDAFNASLGLDELRKKFSGYSQLVEW